MAGIIDGEGTITLNRIKYKNGKQSLRPSIRVANTDVGLIKAVSSWAQCGNVHIYVNGKDVPATIWQTSKTIDIQRILKQIFPYLIVKKRQAELVLEFVSKPNKIPLKQPRPNKNQIIRQNRCHIGYDAEDYEILDRISYLNARGIEGLIRYNEGWNKYGGRI